MVVPAFNEVIQPPNILIAKLETGLVYGLIIISSLFCAFVVNPGVFKFVHGQCKVIDVVAHRSWPYGDVISEIIFALFASVLCAGCTVQFYKCAKADGASDNVCCYLSGVYFWCRLVFFLAACTTTHDHALVFLIALASFLGATGRLLSREFISEPSQPCLWTLYFGSEIVAAFLLMVVRLLFDGGAPSVCSVTGC